jgi:hypothetical protein
VCFVCGCLTGRHRDKKVVGVFVPRFRAPLHSVYFKKRFFVHIIPILSALQWVYLTISTLFFCSTCQDRSDYHFYAADFVKTKHLLNID